MCRSRPRARLSLLWILPGLLLLLVLGGCGSEGSGSPPPVARPDATDGTDQAGAGLQLSLQSAADTFTAGSSLELTAVLLDDAGDPVGGETVTFTTNRGTLDGGGTRVDKTTDDQGQALVTLSATEAGSARVTAAAAGLVRSKTVSVSAGEAASLELTADPSSALANGTDTVTLTARISDAFGNPVSGVSLVFSTDLGTFEDTGAAESEVAAVNGLAQATLVAPLEAGDATVSVAYGSLDPVSVTVSFTAPPPPDLQTFSLTSSTAELVADGAMCAVLTLEALDTLGAAIPALDVAFTTSAGALLTEGCSATGGAGGVELKTDATGKARVWLRAPTRLGSAVVTATSSEVGGFAQQEVSLIPGPPETLVAVASRESLVADGVQTSAIRVVVLDAQAHRVADGTPVSFSVEDPVTRLPEGSLSAYSGQTSGGEVGVTYTAPQGAGDGEATVAVECGNAATQVTIALADEAVGSVALEVADGVLPADGQATTVVTATVRSTGGQPVGDGTVVSFSATGGSFLPSATAATADGTATVTYVAGTQAGPVVITATVGGVTQTASVSLEAGPVASLSILPSLSRIPPDGQTPTRLLIRAEDSTGNPVDGTVSVSASLGTLWVDSPDEAVASVDLVNGEGTVNLSATENGTATVRAAMNDLETSTEIEVGFLSSGEPANVLFTLSQDSVSVAGVGEDEVATLDITVVDEGGNPIDDTPDNVQVEIVEGPNAGETIAGAAMGSSATLSTTNGRVSADFRSGTSPGTVRIRVRVVAGGSLTATAPKITVVSGPPFSLVLGRSNAITDNGDGTLSHECFAIVSDQYGNAVADGTAVYFGQVYNVKWSGTDGRVTEGSDGFESASADFVTAGVVPGDTLILLTGAPRGGYLVESVDASGTSLDLFTALGAGASGVSYVVGNSVGGGTLTDLSPTENGIATATLTYPGVLVNDPVWLYAETAGRTVGDAGAYGLAWVSPTIVTVSGPEEASPGDTLDFAVRITDSASPSHYDIEGLWVTVSATDGTFPSGTSFVTDAWGTVDFQWQVPAGAASGDSFTLTVTAGDGTQQTHTVSVP